MTTVVSSRPHFGSKTVEGEKLSLPWLTACMAVAAMLLAGILIATSHVLIEAVRALRPDPFVIFLFIGAAASAVFFGCSFARGRGARGTVYVTASVVVLSAGYILWVQDDRDALGRAFAGAHYFALFFVLVVALAVVSVIQRRPRKYPRIGMP